MRKKINLNRTTNQSKTFDQGYDEFILYCKAKKLRPATIRFYDNYMLIIYKAILPKTLIKNITPETVENFKMYLKNYTTENDVTRNTNTRALRVILYYFMKLGYMETFQMSLMKVDKKPIETYTDEELKLLLLRVDIKKTGFVDFRENVIIHFLLGTGCRLSTLINIKIKDLYFQNKLITYTWTKNRRQQLVPMSNSLKQVLIEYLQYRKGESDDYLFCNVYGEKINADTLKRQIKVYNNKRGVNKGSIHKFRHTFAKKWILAHGDIFRLQKILGHSSLDIVKNYVNMFTEDLQKDFNTFNPLEQLAGDKKHISMKNGGRK